MTGVPSTSTIRSSGRRPARAAGLSSTTSTTSTAGLAAEPAARAGAAAAARRRRCRGRRGGTAPRSSARAMIRRVALLIGTARPSPTPATAVLMPTTRPSAVRERAARVARVERRVGLDHVVDDARPRRPRRQRAAERRDDARRDRAGEPVRVADRDDELADAQALGVAELGRGRGPLRRSAGRRGPRAGPRRRLELAARARRRTTRAAAPLGAATTCAEVSMKPSGVITTARRRPSSVRPPRTRRATRRFATDGASRSATRVTARE